MSEILSGQTVTVEKMPKTVENFIELRNQIASTPQGGATMFIIALKMYKENEPVGSQCLVIAADRSRLQNGSVYKGFELMRTDMDRIKRQVKQYPYVVESYFEGTTPENGYKTNLPYKLSFSSNSYSGNIEDGEFKIFVKSSGADSPRPIRMVRNNKGYWKAKEWSSIVMGIRKPVVEIDDDL